MALTPFPSSYIYDGDKPILEYNVNGGLVGFNLYGKGIDEILERGATGTDNQWHWSYFQQDHEGSPTHLTDWTGAIIERYRYDAFGAPTIYAPDWTVRTGSSYSNRFLFTGREYDGAWVYEYRARLYHSSLGRFMSEDPKLFVHRINLGASPADWSLSAHPEEAEYNLFRYCGNDPIDFTDPMGLDPFSDFVAGMGDMITFGQAERIADHFFPGYSAAIDHSSAAYRAGQGSGLLMGMATGEGEATAARATARAGEGAAAKSFTPATLAHFERQLQQGGEKSLRSSLKSITQNIEKERAEIKEIKAAGGYTSSKEREIRTFESQVQAIRQILNRLEQNKPPPPRDVPPTELH